MYITQTDVKKILAVMEEFPDARSYKLEQKGQSGIGSNLTLTMDMDINDRKSLVTVEIAGVESW
jgi:hypothetical protein